MDMFCMQKSMRESLRYPPFQIPTSIKLFLSHAAHRHSTPWRVLNIWLRQRQTILTKKSYGIFTHLPTKSSKNVEAILPPPCCSAIKKYSASSRFFPRQVTWSQVGFFDVDIAAGRARRPHKDAETFSFILWTSQ